MVGEAVCRRCGAAAEDAPAITEVRSCVDCRDRRLGYEHARAALSYTDTARAFVRAFKDHGMRGLAHPAAGLIAVTVPRPQADGITWVPPDRWRLIRRGYHPPELLARDLALRWDIEPIELLRQRRRRPPQRGLDLRARRANVRDAFAACAPVPARVVLVDDVHTTGATVEACAHALRRGGARRVEVISLARA